MRIFVALMVILKSFLSADRFVLQSLLNFTPLIEHSMSDLCPATLNDQAWWFCMHPLFYPHRLLGLLMALLLLLSGCSGAPKQVIDGLADLSVEQAIEPLSTLSKIRPLQTAYDYQLIDSQTQQRLTVKQLASQLQTLDIIFIGEFHGNHASHLLEMQLMAALHALRPEQILSMEMFNRDQQPILNRYLDSEIGEAFLITETPTWQNYAGSYRPLIEYAKQQFIPVIAANASAEIVRCIGRQGAAYLDKLLPEQRPLIASNPFTDNKEYRQRYMAFLADARKLTAEHKENSYMAQLTRDNTMAESIYQAWLENPHAQILHLNGSFHSENQLGTVSALQKLNPTLKIAVITPVQVDDPNQPSYGAEALEKGDFIYLLQAQPEQYVDAAYKRQARQSLFKQAEQKPCR